MKLSELVNKVMAKSNEPDPEIYFLALQAGNFVGTYIEVLHRNEYYDETTFGNPVPDGDYIVIEIGG